MRRNIKKSKAAFKNGIIKLKKNLRKVLRYNRLSNKVKNKRTTYLLIILPT
jgi:hypothetical protein